MVTNNGLLAGCRVLDLTTEIALLAGKVLGDYGADVIKIEKPGGDAARNIGPFYHDEADPEKSLFWFATNTSKRGITLNIESREGNELFKRLVKTADIVIESFDPGYMTRLGLAYWDLKQIKPDIILTSITPFGQKGPYAHYRATDLIGSSTGGLVRILGELGSAPVRMSCDPQAYFHAGLQGALGSAMAYYDQQMTGEGQHVDVSMQDAVALTLMNTVEFAEFLKVDMRGTGQVFLSPRKDGFVTGRTIFRCKDGYAYVAIGGGAFLGMAQASREFVKWVNSEGKSMELKDVDWTQWDMSKLTQEDNDWKDRQIAEFVETKTKDELMEAAVQKGIMMAPCNSIENLTNSPHLKERGFWEKVDHPELAQAITYPGAPVKMDTGCWGIRRRAPMIGEHNSEVFGDELGLSREELGLLKASGTL